MKLSCHLTDELIAHVLTAFVWTSGTKLLEKIDRITQLNPPLLQDFKLGTEQLTVHKHAHTFMQLPMYVFYTLTNMKWFPKMKLLWLHVLQAVQSRLTWLSTTIMATLSACTPAKTHFIFCTQTLARVGANLGLSEHRARGRLPFRHRSPPDTHAACRAATSPSGSWRRPGTITAGCTITGHML